MFLGILGKFGGAMSIIPDPIIGMYTINDDI